MTRYTVHDLIRDVRGGPFTSIGSYPAYFLAADGETLSHAAVKANLWQIARATRDTRPGCGFLSSQWVIIGAEINWENEDLYCAQTGKKIECAYPQN